MEKNTENEMETGIVDGLRENYPCYCPRTVLGSLSNYSTGYLKWTSNDVVSYQGPYRRGLEALGSRVRG